MGAMMPRETVRILALDFEGSSKEPRRGCPIQLGVAVMESGKVIASEEWLIRPPLHYRTGKPTREVDAYSLRISGLTLERIEAEGLTSEAVCCQLDAWVQTQGAKDLPVVAYSFTYDAECYSNLLYEGGDYDFNHREYFGYPAILSPTWIDVHQMARRELWPELMHFSLDEVAEHLGLRRETENHEALADAVLAGKVYDRLCDPQCRPRRESQWADEIEEDLFR